MFELCPLRGITLKSLFCLILIAFVTQGCGKNTIVNDGNGHPYEGLTVDGDTPTADQDQKSTLDVREGGVVQNKFETKYLCTNPKSQYLQSLRFGVKPNKREVIIIKTIDSGSFEVDWVEDDLNFYFLRELDSITTVAGLFTEKVFDGSEGRMVVRYSSKLGMIFGEVFDCLAPTIQETAATSNSGRKK